MSSGNDWANHWMASALTLTSTPIYWASSALCSVLMCSEKDIHCSFLKLPTASLPQITLSPKWQAIPEAFWCGYPFCVIRSLPGQWSYTLSSVFPPCLALGSAHSGCLLSFRKKIFRPGGPLAYSTSSHRLDGTVARAKAGVFWNKGQEGGENRAGDWDRSLAEFDSNMLQRHRGIPASPTWSALLF